VKDNSIRVNLLAGVESALNHGGLGAAVAGIISVGVAAVAGAGHDCILTFSRRSILNWAESMSVPAKPLKPAITGHDRYGADPVTNTTWRDFSTRLRKFTEGMDAVPVRPHRSLVSMSKRWWGPTGRLIILLDQSRKGGKLQRWDVVPGAAVRQGAMIVRPEAYIP
jgi:hypothetical protein